MKRTIFGAVIAIISVGIGPAMLAGPSAVLADEADDDEHEEGEEHPHDPENSGGGGGGGSPVQDILDLPALDSLRDEVGRVILDLPALKLLGPDKTKIRVPPPIVPHKPDKGCCGTELTPEQDALLHTVPEVPDPPNPPKNEIVVSRIDISNDIRPQIDLVEDLRQDIDLKLRELDVR